MWGSYGHWRFGELSQEEDHHPPPQTLAAEPLGLSWFLLCSYLGCLALMLLHSTSYQSVPLYRSCWPELTSIAG